MIPLYDRNPTRRTPLVVLGLILINVAVFIYMLALRGSQSEIFVYRFSVVPWEIVHASKLPAAALQQLFTFPLYSVPSKQVYLLSATSGESMPGEGLSSNLFSRPGNVARSRGHNLRFNDRLPGG